MHDLNQKILAVLISVLILAALGGCAPVIRVQSNYDANYQVNLEKAFVVLDTRQLNDVTRRVNYSGSDFNVGVADTVDFTTYFLEALALNFAAVDVEFQVYKFTGLELSENEITDRARAFQADAVLWVKEDWMSVMRDEGFFGLGSAKEVMAIDLNAFIYLADMMKGQAVWRAVLEIESGRGGMPEMARELSATLVNKLVSDGIIVPDRVQKSRSVAAVDLEIFKQVAR